MLNANNFLFNSRLYCVINDCLGSDLYWRRQKEPGVGTSSHPLEFLCQCQLLEH